MAKDIAFDIAFAPAESAVPAKPADSGGLLTRLFRALEQSRQRAAEKEIERWLETSGGRLTDDLEREIGRRMSKL